jgi:large-conductance mechanosensitive channel
MNGPAQYLHFGFILISLANLLVIALLIVVFVLAVALRPPERQRLSTLEAVAPPEEAGDGEMVNAEVRE